MIDLQTKCRRIYQKLKRNSSGERNPKTGTVFSYCGTLMDQRRIGYLPSLIFVLAFLVFSFRIHVFQTFKFPSAIFSAFSALLVSIVCERFKTSRTASGELLYPVKLKAPEVIPEASKKGSNNEKEMMKA